MTALNDNRQACCPAWDELGAWVDAALIHYQVSGGKVPDVAFKFCPWCGAERLKQPDRPPGL